MTENHDYNTPSRGTTDWHNPLNANFEDLDADMEIRDIARNRGSYTPLSGAKFLATDTGVVSTADGTAWLAKFALPRYTAPANSDNAGRIALGYEGNVVDADGATISGGGKGGSSPAVNSVLEDFGTVGGGRGNIADGKEATVGGGSNNLARDGAATIGGGKDNFAENGATVAGGANNEARSLDSTIGGGNDNEAIGKRATVAGGGAYDTNTSTSFSISGNSADADGAFVGGGSDNSASGEQAAVVGGGGYAVDKPDSSGSFEFRGNTASGDRSFVGGGNGNSASGEQAAVVGGGSSLVASIPASGNTASGDRSFVGAGGVNEASGFESTVCGGNSNTASGEGSFVGGGFGNVASGENAIALGGANNNATSKASFAAGRQAEANARGAFAWGDDSTNTVRSERVNKFTVQAGGGVVFYSSSDLSTGVSLGSGEGTWNSVSSRTMKTDIDPVDPGTVLQEVEDLDVATWEYDSDSEATHMGPMAEDFHDAFGLGPDDKHISNVDADGVALAAIQGLAERVDTQSETIDEQAETIEDQQDALAERADRIADLEAENEALRERLDDLEAAVSDLQAKVETHGPDRTSTISSDD
jgi:hypothetical protein